MAEYANDSLNPSVTSGSCLWKKKERRSTDNPVPANELSTSLPGPSRSEPSTTEYYDPCPGRIFALDAELDTFTISCVPMKNYVTRSFS